MHRSAITAAPLTLGGAIVLLEPLTLAHVDALTAIGLDPALWAATTIRVRGQDEMRAYVERALGDQARGSAVPFAIRHAVEGRIVGTSRFHHLSPENRRVEIGFTWIGRQWQRTAVNSATKYWMLRHAFERWDCLRVEFRADADNRQSCDALRRLGAREEAVLRRAMISAHRGPRDVRVFSILSTEWSAVRASLEARLGIE